MASHETADLIFYRVIGDAALAQRDPSKYQMLEEPDAAGARRYVEREPAVKITTGEIQSVAIEHTSGRVEQALQKELENRGLGRGTTTSKGLLVTFVLSESAGRRLNQFIQGESDGLVDIWLGRYRLATPRLIGTFEGSTFALGLAETEEGRIREIFRPLGNKFREK
jgi:hypothetical protein